MRDQGRHAIAAGAPAETVVKELLDEAGVDEAAKARDAARERKRLRVAAWRASLDEAAVARDRDAARERMRNKRKAAA